MEAISYTELRTHLKTVMDEVSDRHEPVIVHRKSGEDIIILSYSDYAAMEETAYLLRSPKNAQWLSQSLMQSRQGKVYKKKLRK